MSEGKSEFTRNLSGRIPEKMSSKELYEQQHVMPGGMYKKRHEQWTEGCKNCMIAKNVSVSDCELLKEQNFVGGQWVDARHEKLVDVLNPATLEVIGKTPNSSTKDVELAIEAAKRAQCGWCCTTAKKRAYYLMKVFQYMHENKKDLATIITAENGKPLKQALEEVEFAASFLAWYAGEASRVYGDVIPAENRSTRVITLKQPVGVVGALTPWNFPCAMVTRKIGAALAAGCAVVLKPSEKTPFSAYAIAELFRRAGLPDGVLNVVCGDAKTIAEALCSSDDVRKITFTGSTSVGKSLIKDCSDTCKRMSMELGGNAPFIVFNDADLDCALKGAMSCKFENCGQTCISVNRFLVQSEVYERFCRMLEEKIKQLRVGPGTDEGACIGPLINEDGFKKVKKHVEDATAKGGKVLVGGKPHELGHNYFQPTLIVDVKDDMCCSTDETFGPIACVRKFETEEEAVRLANDTCSGLAGYFYTRDIARVWRLSERLQFGLVGANETDVSSASIPFGGMKDSGFGIEGSKYGLDDYLHIKSVAFGGLCDTTQSQEFL